MKKKSLVKLATLMVAITGSVADLARLPQSLLLWGEPTPPMEKPKN